MQQVNAPGVRWEWISEAWNLFTKQWSAWVLMILVMCLVMGLIYLPFYAIAFFSMMPSVSEDGAVSAGAGFLPIVIFPVMYLAIVCVASWLSGGLYSAAFKQLRGEQISVGDLFSGGRHFSRMIGAFVWGVGPGRVSLRHWEHALSDSRVDRWRIGLSDGPDDCRRRQGND
jgi:hypothetical protein